MVIYIYAHHMFMFDDYRDQISVKLYVGRNLIVLECPYFCYI